MIKVGLTGGIGSGKSTVSKVFARLGIPVYLADEEARQLVDNSTEIKSAIQQYFGKDILDKEGHLRRKALAEIVFKDKVKLDQLNSIIHPAVQKHFVAWASGQVPFPYVIKEAAILFESGSYKNVDVVITVSAPLELRIKRIEQRDGVSRESVLERIKNQLSEEERIKRSQYVINNDEEQLLIPQILSVHQELIKKSQGS